MARATSEYTFPIFISSTDYNLRDLRAELARFLSALGYKPILSSSEGFPDSSPRLEPWESCLPTLDTCFVMVLIIDGKYGQPLEWPNYSELIEGKLISPTHAEYLFAHKNNQRMLVFIRQEIMVCYQSYREVLKKCEGDKSKAKEILLHTLPKYIDFDTLEFIQEVKTTKPIPWINEFDDITSIKREIQHKMLNELAQLFLIKQLHYETVISSFNKMMGSLSPGEQKKALGKVEATKDIVTALEDVEKYKEQIESQQKLADQATGAERMKFQNEIKSLKKKIIELEIETQKSTDNQFFIKGGELQFGKLGLTSNLNNIGLTSNLNNIGLTSNLNNVGLTSNLNNVGLTSNLNSVTTWNSPGLSGSSNVLSFKTGRKCDNCEKEEINQVGALSSLSSQYTRCPKCKRLLCSECWSKYPASTAVNFSNLSGKEKCPKCRLEEA